MNIPELADRMSYLVFEAGGKMQKYDWEWLSKKDSHYSVMLRDVPDMYGKGTVKVSLTLEKIFRDSAVPWTDKNAPFIGMESKLKGMRELSWFSIGINFLPESNMPDLKPLFKVYYTFCDVLKDFFNRREEEIAIFWDGRDSAFDQKMFNQFAKIMGRCFRGTKYKVFKKGKVGVIINKKYVK